MLFRSPETLRRFVSFVNAPGTPDPAIEFELERGQIKPVAVSIGPAPAGQGSGGEGSGGEGSTGSAAARDEKPVAAGVGA